MALETPSSIEYTLRHTGGVTVEFSGESTWGHLDYPEEVLFPEDYGVQSTDPFITVAAGIFTTDPTTGDSITVDGTTWKVRSPPRAVNDGRELRIELGTS